MDVTPYVVPAVIAVMGLFLAVLGAVTFINHEPPR